MKVGSSQTEKNWEQKATGLPHLKGKKLFFFKKAMDLKIPLCFLYKLKLQQKTTRPKSKCVKLVMRHKHGQWLIVFCTLHKLKLDLS